MTRVLMTPDGGDGGTAGNITPEELKQAIEKARLEERSRLQADAEASKKLVEEIKAKLAEKEAAEARLQADLEAITKSKTPEGGVDLKALIAEVTAKVVKDANAAIETVRQETAAQVSALQKQVQEKDLQVLRDRLIAEAGGPEKLVSVSLIRGNTEEELRKAVKDSAEEYARITSAFTAAGGTPGGAGATASAGRASGQPPLPSASSTGGAAGGTNPDPLTGDNIKNMSPQDWAANRTTLLAKVKARYTS